MMRFDPFYEFPWRKKVFRMVGDDVIYVTDGAMARLNMHLRALKGIPVYDIPCGVPRAIFIGMLAALTQVRHVRDDKEYREYLQLVASGRFTHVGIDSFNTMLFECLAACLAAHNCLLALRDGRSRLEEYATAAARVICEFSDLAWEVPAALSRKSQTGHRPRKAASPVSDALKKAGIGSKSAQRRRAKKLLEEIQAPRHPETGEKLDG